jgi:pimeloyl-ACP methyl ester carboxylesterase
MNPDHPQPVQRTHHFNGLDFAWFEWGEFSQERPSLLFVHATGFHGRVWDDIIERFPDCHAIAFELHGHGRSEGGPIEHTRELFDPLTDFVRNLDHGFTVGVGHSMGAHALVVVASAIRAFDRLLLIDPTIFTPESYQNEAEYRAGFTPGNAPSERRRREFPSPEAMKEALAEKGSFAVYTPRIYDDYCRFGLIEQADGNYQLACAPEMEASVYLCARSNSRIFDCVRSLEIPVFIMRAQERSRREPGHMDFAFSPTWPELVNQFPDARETYYPELTHFIAMQDPDEVERVLRRELDLCRS